MRYFSLILVIAILGFLTSCEERECPEGMEECMLDSGVSVCVPEDAC